MKLRNLTSAILLVLCTMTASQPGSATEQKVTIDGIQYTLWASPDTVLYLADVNKVTQEFHSLSQYL